ncbi:MAG: LytTR family transcriptional regulator [Lachnospiraceae bacterium]|nr:LytTR family transcriptional regulator [Lachnospiraceae bacterium]
MKIRIEQDESLAEEEIILRCRALTGEVRQIQNAIASAVGTTQNFILYKEDTEYYVALEDILFFETENGSLNAHTRDNVYQTKCRLYELEEMLPGHFLRVSKSTIVNVWQIYSLRKSSFSTISEAAFFHSHKKVFVSRHYVRALREKLTERQIQQNPMP